MFDLVEHLPIKNPTADILLYRREVLEKLKARASKLGYEPPSTFRFRVVKLPLSRYIECRALVVPLDLERLLIEHLRGKI
ncbi:hypothetical protein AAFM46_10935 [Arthrobacter sp. TMP15]|uniref:hypothetical protein n=1 Tax=Arthrobacter sp. TMP15 TaxID=3140789 RepID=UPI0031BA7192